MADRTLSSPLPKDDVDAIDELRDVYGKLTKELGKIIVGQESVIEQLAICLFARGHALLMGVPGLAKTLLISRLAETLSLSFNRIQFTPDLMPMDITGTDILQELPGGKREFQFAKGTRVRQHRAGRRDQPRALQDAGRHARSHAGGSRHRGRAHLPPGLALFRAGDAEPHRAGGHLPAARGAVGPLHVHDRRRLPVARGGNRHRPLHHRHGPAPARTRARRSEGAGVPGPRAPRARAGPPLRTGRGPRAPHPPPVRARRRAGSSRW